MTDEEDAEIIRLVDEIKRNAYDHGWSDALKQIRRQAIELGYTHAIKRIGERIAECENGFNEPNMPIRLTHTPTRY